MSGQSSFQGLLANTATSGHSTRRGMSSAAYLAVALAMGGVLLIYSHRLSRARSVPAARAFMAAVRSCT